MKDSDFQLLVTSVRQAGEIKRGKMKPSGLRMSRQSGRSSAGAGRLRGRARGARPAPQMEDSKLTMASASPLIREHRPEDFERLFQIDQAAFVPALAYSRAELQYYLLARRSKTLGGEGGGEGGGVGTAR